VLTNYPEGALLKECVNQDSNPRPSPLASLKFTLRRAPAAEGAHVRIPFWQNGAERG
jgi:hypothetical protein